MEDLTLKGVSDRINYSASHFRAIYKKPEGEAVYDILVKSFKPELKKFIGSIAQLLIEDDPNSIQIRLTPQKEQLTDTSYRRVLYLLVEEIDAMLKEKGVSAEDKLARLKDWTKKMKKSM
jgi:hypothetical protein